MHGGSGFYMSMMTLGRSNQLTAASPTGTGLQRGASIPIQQEQGNARWGLERGLSTYMQAL